MICVKCLKCASDITLDTLDMFCLEDDFVTFTEMCSVCGKEHEVRCELVVTVK